MAPGTPVGNTGLAAPILTGGGIKETRHRCAMCGFLWNNAEASFGGPGLASPIPAGGALSGLASPILTGGGIKETRRLKEAIPRKEIIAFL